MIVGGVLLAANRRVAGGLLILLSFTFLLLTQDNPMLIEHIKPKPKTTTIRMDDLSRHISLMGAILYMMVVPPCLDEEPDHDEFEDKKKKKKKTQ